MDVLNDIFETIQLKGMLYFRTDFTPPWGTTVPAYARAARFHHVVRGRCYVRVAGGAELVLEPGELIFIPNGVPHVLADGPRDDAPPLEEVLRSAGYTGEHLLVVGKGDPAAATQLVCGHFAFGEGADHPLLRALPPYIRVTNAMRVRRPWLDEVLRLIVSNVFSGHAGAVAVVTRLSEILFIEAIRSAGDEAPDLRQLMDAFGDERIGRAIALIHREPARAWTVGTLAREVAMSRTRFAERFHQMIGVGPIGYLAEWRLQKALSLLTTTRRPISAIAHAGGYASPAAFTRAFRDRFGRSPLSVRRNGMG